MNTIEAYARCQEVTRHQARNFSYGIRLLPPAKRRAMSALYAVARGIDDIGDGTDPTAVKLAGLAGARRRLAAIATDTGAAGDDAALIALADALRRYPIPLSALHELIDGCEMDVRGMTYDSFDDLIGYCRRVGGTVGRLSLGIYGVAEPAVAIPLADALGVALQLTNILRDVVEDRDTMGRVYLPRADLERFGVDPGLFGPLDSLIGVISFEATRAERFYAEGLGLLPLLDRRSRACTAAMVGIYRRLLARIRHDPAAVLHSRVSLPSWEKSAVAVRALTRGTA